MKFTKESMNLENGLDKEWVITNGIGGYSSSTIISANTRKYHGLLVASLTPPARRFLILSKLDESIETRGKKYELYTNIGKEYISKGFNYLESFEKEKNIIPTFKYKIGKIEIIKKICMDYGKNTVGIYYKIKNGAYRSKLTLAPVINFRDFHTVNTNHVFNLKQINTRGNKVRISVDGNSYTPIYMNLSDGEYIPHENDSFNNMFYIEEEKRGFATEENHAVPGRYEVEIKAKEEKEISFVCSLEENIEEIDVRNLIEKEEKRLNNIFKNSELVKESTRNQKEESQNELIKTFLIAADSFVVNRYSFGLHTLLAGYHWFLDWGRDALISFEGILLIPKRYDLARELLKTMTRDVKYGLVPNGYSGYDNRPLYNSVDASLLLFEAIQKYLDYTKDYKFVKEELYDVMKTIIENYCKGIDVDENNIYLDVDGLIVSGTENTQNTWMDVKFQGKAVTPRNGKAVEVNSLWYNANKIMAELSIRFGHILAAMKYKELAENCKFAFQEKFYNSKTKCLYDVLEDSKIRPNQLFAMSLSNPIIDVNSNEAKDIINVVEKKLLNAYGLKTLAKDEENYVEVYEGDEEHRDTSYHQGITWPWLLGLYYNALKNMRDYEESDEQKESLQQKIDKFSEKTKKTFTKEIYENGCIGAISEIYDSAKPQLPKGCIAQCWSIAEIFRIILKK